MGGNALKNAITERKNRADYKAIMNNVMAGIELLFPDAKYAEVQAYRSKQDFGDGDILLCEDKLPKDWIAQIKKMFNPKQIFINRIGGRPVSVDRDEDVPELSLPMFAVSFDYEKFQIDLVIVQEDIFEIAQIYYSYNDLGNFMGRIADRMGFKYGWDGMTALIRKPGDMTITMGSVFMTKDPVKIFNFLGYDYERYKQGFDTLEEVYAFAASTPYFSRRVYALEQRNNKDRVRDEKRSSYSGFLKWQDAQGPEIDKYYWCSYPLNEWSVERWKEIAHWHQVACNYFPDFNRNVTNVMAEFADSQQAKHVWNGKEVVGYTGYSGPKLGEFMNYCANVGYAYEEDSRGLRFATWVKDKSHAEVAAFVRRATARFEERLAKRAAV